MSIRTIAAEFKAKTNDLYLSSREAKALLKNARKGGVTANEGALIGKYADRAVTADPIQVRITDGTFFAAEGTAKLLKDFAARYGATAPANLSTGDQLWKLYTALADERQAAGTGKALEGAPVANPNDYPSRDITPEGLMDVSMSLYVIDNRLVHRQSGFGPQGIVSFWTDLGPALV